MQHFSMQKNIQRGLPLESMVQMMSSVDLYQDLLFFNTVRTALPIITLHNTGNYSSNSIYVNLKNKNYSYVVISRWQSSSRRTIGDQLPYQAYYFYVQAFSLHFFGSERIMVLRFQLKLLTRLLRSKRSLMMKNHNKCQQPITLSTFQASRLRDEASQLDRFRQCRLMNDQIYMKSTSDYHKKQMEYRSNIVGQDFHTEVRSENDVCVNIFGEIVEAIDFEADSIFLQWEWTLPDGWDIDNTELLEFDVNEYDQVQLEEWNRLSSVTQSVQPETQRTSDGKLQQVAHFCFPFDLQFQVPKQSLLGRFPTLLFQINSVDSWDRNKIEGYGFIEVPRQPGYHEIRVPTYKPNDDIYTRIYEFFLGGAIKVKEFQQIADTFTLNQSNQRSPLNRYSINTESSGEVIIRLNITFQEEQFKQRNRKIYAEQQKGQLFQKFREQRKQQAPQTGMPTTMMKTDMGLINRFTNTNLSFN